MTYKTQKVVWKNGPLDGCVDLVERPTALWIGPDTIDPEHKFIVYALYTDGGDRLEYRYDQHLTDHANNFPEGNAQH